MKYQSVEQYHILDLLKQLKSAPPDDVALIFITSASENKITYATLQLNIAKAKSILLTKELQPKEVAAIVLPFGFELVTWVLACMELGIVPCIFPYHYANYRQPKDVDNVIRLARKIETKAIIGLQQIATVYEKSEDALLFVNPAIAKYTGKIMESPSLQVDLEDIAFIQLSSGTTGPQKGVKLSYRAINHCLYGCMLVWKMKKETDKVLNWLPLYHDYALFCGFIMPLLEQVLVLLLSPSTITQNPSCFFQTVSKYSVSISVLFNGGLHLLNKVADSEIMNFQLDSLRIISIGGELNQFESQEMFFKRFSRWRLKRTVILTGYGMAESVMCVTTTLYGPPTIHWINGKQIKVGDNVQFLDNSDNNALSVVSNGPPLEGATIGITVGLGKIVESEYRIGEIMVKSPTLFSGYVQGKTHYPENWYATGDIGYIAKGELYVCGRKKDIIICAGQNIYPPQVELEILTYCNDWVRRVVFVGHFDEKIGTEKIIILCELRKASAIVDETKLADLKSFCQGLLFRKYAMSTARVALVKKGVIKKSSAGKIARKETKLAWLASLEKEAAKKKNLDLRERINFEYSLSIPDDQVNLLKASIDSITLLGIVTLAEHETSRTIPMYDFIKNPTIAFLKGNTSAKIQFKELPKAISQLSRKGSLKKSLINAVKFRGPYLNNSLFITYSLGMLLNKLLLHIPSYRNFFFQEEIKIFQQLQQALNHKSNLKKTLIANLHFNTWGVWKEKLFKNEKLRQKYIRELHKEKVINALEANKNVILAYYHTPFKFVFWDNVLFTSFPFLHIGNIHTKDFLIKNGQSNLPKEILEQPSSFGNEIKLDQLQKARALLQRKGNIIGVAIDGKRGQGGILTQQGSIKRYIREGILEEAIQSKNTAIFLCKTYLIRHKEMVIDYGMPIDVNANSKETILRKFEDHLKEIWMNYPESLDFNIQRDMLAESKRLVDAGV